MRQMAMFALLICLPLSANTLLVSSSQKQIDYNKALGCWTLVLSIWVRGE